MNQLLLLVFLWYQPLNDFDDKHLEIVDRNVVIDDEYWNDLDCPCPDFEECPDSEFDIIIQTYITKRTKPRWV